MIEVESRFLLTAAKQELLLEGATFSGETRFNVQVLDYATWDLAYNNIWLKLKNGKYELKMPLQGQAPSEQGHLATVFDEISDNQKILALLRLPANENIAEELEKAGIHSIASIDTIRASYKKGQFFLDLDTAKFSLLASGEIYHYSVAEIEIQTTPDHVAQARQDIIDFAHKHGLEVSDIRGKLMEFIFQNYPEVYKEFVRRKIISQ